MVTSSSSSSSEQGSEAGAAIESLYEQDFLALREEALRTGTLFTVSIVNIPMPLIYGCRLVFA